MSWFLAGLNLEHSGGFKLKHFILTKENGDLVFEFVPVEKNTLSSFTAFSFPIFYNEKNTLSTTSCIIFSLYPIMKKHIVHYLLYIFFLNLIMKKYNVYHMVPIFFRISYNEKNTVHHLQQIFSLYLIINRDIQETRNN